MGRRAKRREPRENTTTGPVAPAAPPPPPPAPGPDRRTVAAVLFAAAFLLYAPAVSHPFTSFDDGLYVLTNPQVRQGLTAENVRWAFTTGHTGYWQPLTWLSFQLDATLFDDIGRRAFGAGGVAFTTADRSLSDGRSAWGYHLTNALLHAANVALLYGVLSAATGCRWRPALAAALWGLHPLRVESVVWVTERKDVLSTFFWLLATAAYLRYARRPSVGRYLPVAAGMAAGLMAKPMVVTLPFALLLLDVWPLRRAGDPAAVCGLLRGRVPPGLGRLVAEKIPLFVLAAAGAVIAVRTQTDIGAVARTDALPLAARVANAPVSYLMYLAQTVWPVGLAPYYPYTTRPLTDPLVLAAVAVLVGLTAAAVGSVGSRPYLAVGWLWFVGTLVPVIGLVQAGSQARADRFTYVPAVGLAVAAAWGAAEVAGRWGVRAGLRYGLAAAVLCGSAALTWRQVGRWADDVQLWEYTRSVNGVDSAEVLNNLAMALGLVGREQDAVPPLREAAALAPNSPVTRFLLGQTLAELGRDAEALPEMEAAYRLDPQSHKTRRNLGVLLARAGRVDDALPHLVATADGDRPEPFARLLLGRELLSRGFPAEAADQLGRVSETDPDDPGVWLLLGTAQTLAGRFGPAEASLREAARLEAARLRSNNPVTLARLGLVVLRRGDHAEAVRQCRAAVAAAPGAPNPRIDLGLALRAAGDAAGSDAEYAAATRAYPQWPAEYARAAWQGATTSRPGTSAYLAVCQARQACEATGFTDAGHLAALAAALAADGDFGGAEAQVVAARTLAEKAGNVGMVRDLDGHLARYKAGKSLRDPP